MAKKKNKAQKHHSWHQVQIKGAQKIGKMAMKRSMYPIGISLIAIGLTIEGLLFGIGLTDIPPPPSDTSDFICILKMCPIFVSCFNIFVDPNGYVRNLERIRLFLGLSDKNL